MTMQKRLRVSYPVPLGVQLGVNGVGPFGRRPEEDLPGVLDILAELGYDGAETHPNAWYAGPVQVSGAFARAGLDLAALHVFETEASTSDLRARMLDDAATAGCPRIIVTSHDKRTRQDFLLLAELLEELAVDGRQLGISILYHLHDFDFWPLADRKAVRGVDVLLDRADPELLAFNLDIYWAHIGGVDPVAMITKLGDRCDYYHVRDGDALRSCPLGRGEIPLAESLEAIAKRSRKTKWLIYEDPKPQLPPAALCRAAKDYLRAQRFTGQASSPAPIRLVAGRDSLE